MKKISKDNLGQIIGSIILMVLELVFTYEFDKQEDD